MKIYVDNNISYRLARALHHLSSQFTRQWDESVEIIALKDSDFGHDAPDEAWIPKIAEAKDWIFTQDISIRKYEQERALLMQYGINAVFLRSSNATNGYWKMVKRTINAWPDVIKCIEEKRGLSHTAIEIDLRDKVVCVDYSDS